MIHRRLLLKAAGSALFAGALQKYSFATTSTLFGPWQIDVISDGYIELPVSRSLLDATDDELEEYMGAETVASGRHRVDCNLVVLRRDDQIIVIDAGAGPSFLESTGTGLEALSVLGIEPEQVTHVLFTHGHPDHLWGVKDDFDEVLFFNAEHWISEVEWNYWSDANTVSRIDASRQFFAVGAKDRLGLIAEQSKRFQPDREILPGITALATYGHTPGHVSFQLDTGTESMVIVGDALTNARYSLEAPSRLSGADQDGQQAAATRLQLLDLLARQNSTVIGFHFPFPGVGRVERRVDGSKHSYRFLSS